MLDVSESSCNLSAISDPTENDSVMGLRPNARGPGLVTFGPDRVKEFCEANGLQMIIRAHECVMDGAHRHLATVCFVDDMWSRSGFERFAQGQLITLFSATNYCGTANNAGAILVLGRDLVVYPKLIHPLPPQAALDDSPVLDRGVYARAHVTGICADLCPRRLSWVSNVAQRAAAKCRHVDASHQP